MNANRKDARNAFANYIGSNLTGLGLIQKWYPYLVSDFGAQSPVVVVGSNGSVRQAFPPGRASFQLNVYVFVLYSSEDGSWTEEMAEDRLDDIEHALSELLPVGNALGQLDNNATKLDTIQIGRQAYRREIIPVLVEAY